MLTLTTYVAMPNPRLEGILFDLDGTLLDSAHDLLYALNLALNENNIDSITYQDIRPHITHGAYKIVSRGACINEDDKKHKHIVDRFLHHYQNNLGTKAPLFPGVAELLNKLDEQSIPWGIITNKYERYTIPLLDKLNLGHRTKCIVCGDTLETAKPHPLMLLYGCKLLQTNNEKTLYVGDYKSDIVASKAAHMPSVLVTYGYHEDHHNLNDWGAQFIADSPKDIIYFIGNTSKI